jgi:hypothetical protein
MDDDRPHDSPATIPGVVRVLLLIDFSLAALYMLDAAAGHPASIITRLVDLDAEANMTAWFASSQILLLGLLFCVFLAGTPRENRTWVLYVLPLFCFGLSLDEIAQLHEWVSRRSDALFASGTRRGTFVDHTGLWMFLLGPVFVLAVVLAWKGLARFVRGHHRAIKLYSSGVLVYGASALGTESLSNLVTIGTFASRVKIMCEELGEMIGITLLVWATIDLLAAHRIRVAMT